MQYGSFFFSLTSVCCLIRHNKQGNNLNDKKYINSISRFKTPKGTPSQSRCETHRLGSFHKETAEHLDHTEAEKQKDAGARLMVRQRMCERDSQRRCLNKSVNNLSLARGRGLTTGPLGSRSPLWWWTYLRRSLSPPFSHLGFLPLCVLAATACSALFAPSASAAPRASSSAPPDAPSGG